MVLLAHITDAHVTRQGKATATLKDRSVHSLLDLVAQAKATDVDFTVFGGDNIDNRADGYDDLQAFCEVADSGTDYCVIAGNHEACLRARGVPLGEFARRFADRGLDADSLCFSRAVGDVRVIGVNTVLEGNVGGYVSEAAMAFLARELGHASESHVVVVGHHLLERTWAPHHLPAWDSDYLIQNREDVVSLLTTCPKVRAYLCGHHHASSIRRVGSRGGAGFYQMVTPSPVAFPHGARLLDIDDKGIQVSMLSPSNAKLRALGREAVLGGRKASRLKAIGVSEKELCDYLAGKQSDNHVFLPHAPAKPRAATRRPRSVA